MGHEYAKTRIHNSKIFVHLFHRLNFAFSRRHKSCFEFVTGTDEERGISIWRKQHSNADDVEDSAADKAPDTTFDLPFGMAAVRRWNWTRYFPICPTFTGFSIYKECSCCQGTEKEESVEDGINCLAYDNSFISTEKLTTQEKVDNLDSSISISL